MNHRHLLPDEIDLLLDDDEVGFGVNPLRSHLRECADCRAQVEDARLIVDVLEDLPHFAPSHDFASRVMSQVPVFVPWHVSARQTIARFVPRSRSAQIALGALATSVASILTVAASDQVRGLIYDAGRTVLATVFGDQMFAIIQSTGRVGIAAALLGLAAATGGSIVGLRALATASSRRRA